MRTDFLKLIDQVENIKSNFHVLSGGVIGPQIIINDRPEFINWKQEVQFELQEIFDRTHDQYIWGTLTLLKLGFNGWKDEKTFNELSGSLNTVKKNIDRYYPAKIEKAQNARKESALSAKIPKVFISHSSYDIAIVSNLVNLFEGIGLCGDQLFCSSIPGYGIPLDSDIYGHLREQFQNYNLHVIFALSKNYYDSVACMNEMGAAWVLQSTYTMILLPGFEYKEITGAVNPMQISIKLDDDTATIKENLRQLKNNLIQEFNLSVIPEARWEHKRDEFISTVLQSSSETGFKKDAEMQIKLENVKDRTMDYSHGKSLSVNKISEEISLRTTIEKKLYSDESLEGKVRFEYDNNNGEFLIGSGECSFITKWSRSGNDSIHAYGSIGYDRSLLDFPNDEELKQMNFSSYSRTICRGQIVVWHNSFNNFAAVKILSVKSSGHGFPIDELEFEYKIYH